ncbi:MAG: hypothetical protein NUV80_02225 [Candidatus Berkelbacteria bacterium]|nr:hypothetical protein [Candidatus Berkelbacteria bacterium]MCR4307349.1 hypothetical protein [Candidatus Berkelbacteria bacterium]
MSQKAPFRTVAQVVLETLAGDKIEVVVVHRNPFHRDVGYRPDTTLGDDLDGAKVPIPVELIDEEIGWEQLEPFLRYDERFARTVNFTIWSNNWVIEHRWVIDCSPNCGGQIVRFRKTSRHPTTHNEIAERFPDII